MEDPPARPDSSVEYAETRSVTLEWKLSGLRQLFEGSKGESKSKCLKSAFFDSGRWQVFLYANSGHQQYISLYLSCEPTASEIEKGAMERGASSSNQMASKGAVAGGNGKSTDGKGEQRVPWRREGKFKFTFEAKSLDSRMTFKQMEASDHGFSESARNWGYQNFWTRSDAYFNNPTVKLADAMLICCTIEYSPTPPSAPPPPRLLIPKNLVNAYASLFDDPAYSDVVFRIRPAKGGRERKLFAAKKVLSGRSEYFDTMFSSGFNESTTINPETMSNSSTYEQDSNDEDGDESDECDEDDDSDLEGSDAYSSAEEEAEEVQFVTRSTAVSDKGDEPTSATIRSLGDVGEEEGAPSNELDKSDEEDVASGSRKVGHHERTSSHRYPTTTGHHREASQNDVDTGSVLQRRIGPGTTRKRAKPRRGLDGRPRFEVIVTDASYSTFRALIYYLYTDSVTFAPLSSTYQALLEHAQHTSTPFPFASRKAYLQATFPLAATSVDRNGIRPCSSKAAYRLADKLGLAELKSRAFDFLIGSLTVQNIPYEVFGSFSLRFEEVKRVEIAFLLDKWNEVRASPSMRKVFNHIRIGRFPGFEDVWGRILESLEYRPKELVGAPL